MKGTSELTPPSEDQPTAGKKNKIYAEHLRAAVKEEVYLWVKDAAKPHLVTTRNQRRLYGIQCAVIVVNAGYTVKVVSKEHHKIDEENDINVTKKRLNLI